MGIVTRRALALGMLLSVFAIGRAAFAGETSISDVRLWTAPDHTRIVFDLSAPVHYRVFRLKGPDRIVVDFHQSRMQADIDHLPLPEPVITGIRHGQPKPGVLRLVLDVRERVKPRSFLLKPLQGKPHRLVIDLVRPAEQEGEVITAESVRASRDVIIAVDAGHGGDDPGAIGPYGLQEKHVTLAVARALADNIDRRPGMRAVLIRKGDYFVSLRKRVTLARKAKADLMISIHADAVDDRRVAGASVYTMSEKGASDKMAALLAAKENAADAIGGAMPDEVADPVVNRILADLIKRDSLNSAQLLAENIIKSFGGVGPIKYERPKRARFVVLGAPEIPSVLVEVDYISNPRRERLLKTEQHQQRLAQALLAASENFLLRQGRLKLVEDERVHIVRPGESLWSIARRYGISMRSLLSANGFEAQRHLRVGQRLMLPQS